MPVNWEEFDEELASAIAISADRTDERLASRLSSLTRMTDEEIMELCPTPGDVKAVSELMKVVESSTTRNNKIAHIVENVEQLGGIILPLITKL